MTPLRTRRPAVWLFALATILLTFSAIYLPLKARQLYHAHQATKAQDHARLQALALAEVERKQARDREEAEAGRLRQDRESQARETLRLQEEADARRKAAAAQSVIDSQTRRQALLTAYLRSTNSFKSPDKISLVVAITHNWQTIDDAFGDRVIGKLPPEAVIGRSIFTPAAATNYVIKSVASSDRATIANLGLTALSDYLLIADYQVDFTTNVGLNNLVTAMVSMTGTIIDSESGAMQGSFQRRASGAGLIREEAESNAKDRIVQSLTNVWNLKKK